ncbi:MAG: thermonuclease family protein [Dehalococcoidia bacterium]|nr:thermonuclease family protein [Dehalococcoidia bacterium]
MKNSKKLEKEGLDIINDIQNKIEKNNQNKKSKKIISITSTTILVIIAFVFWGAVDKIGDAVGETVAGVVGTDLDNAKSNYYLTDEFLELKVVQGKGSSYSLYSECQVTKVKDGDTIDVDCPFNKNETIRYAYLDTPEVWKKVNGKWEEDNQCFGKEASNINKELVEGKKVLIFDQSLTKDPYGRRISKVIVKDGKDKNLMVNEFLVGEGYATVYYSRDPLFKMLNLGKEENMENMERVAKKYNKGLWDKCN